MTRRVNRWLLKGSETAWVWAYTGFGSCFGDLPRASGTGNKERNVSAIYSER